MKASFFIALFSTVLTPPAVRGEENSRRTLDQIFRLVDVSYEHPGECRALIEGGGWLASSLEARARSRLTAPRWSRWLTTDSRFPLLYINTLWGMSASHAARMFQFDLVNAFMDLPSAVQAEVVDTLLGFVEKRNFDDHARYTEPLIGVAVARERLRFMMTSGFDRAPDGLFWSPGALSSRSDYQDPSDALAIVLKYYFLTQIDVDGADVAEKLRLDPVYGDFYFGGQNDWGDPSLRTGKFPVYSDGTLMLLLNILDSMWDPRSASSFDGKAAARERIRMVRTSKMYDKEVRKHAQSLLEPREDFE